MDTPIVKLTVYFEGPFWVGVLERLKEGALSVCKVTFGTEPKDYDVWEYILHHYYELDFSPAVKSEGKPSAANPKRRQRDVRKQLQDTGIGTKSQQALAAQREEQKTERKKAGRAQREAEKQRRFDLKQQKRKEKHKGR